MRAMMMPENTQGALRLRYCLLVIFRGYHQSAAVSFHGPKARQFQPRVWPPQADECAAL